MQPLKSRLIDSRLSIVVIQLLFLLTYSVFAVTWLLIAGILAYGQFKIFSALHANVAYFLVIPVLIICYFARLKSFWSDRCKFNVETHLNLFIFLLALRVFLSDILSPGGTPYKFVFQHEIIFHTESRTLLGFSLDAVVNLVSISWLAFWGWSWMNIRKILYKPIEKIKTLRAGSV